MNAGCVAGGLPRSETLDVTKARIDSLWGNYYRIKSRTNDMVLFDRVTPCVSSDIIDAYLAHENYPPRTIISELSLDSWVVMLNQKFVRDGFMYLLRGDAIGFASKGFYSKVYGYSKYSTKEIEGLLKSSREVGYFLYESDIFLTHPTPSYAGVAEELMFSQSAIGGSSFVSTTTSIPCAVVGSGVQSGRGVLSVCEVYVVKVPVEHVINSNTDNYFGINEDEVLVADYISSHEIVATFARTDTEGVYAYMHNLLGVTREDMRMEKADAKAKTKDDGREEMEKRYKMVS